MKKDEFEKIFKNLGLQMANPELENPKTEAFYDSEYNRVLENEYSLTLENLKSREIQDLILEPFIENQKIIDLYNSLFKICNTTYETTGNFYWIYILRMVNILLENGNIKSNSIYSIHSIYLASRGEFNSAYKFSLLELNLNREYNNDSEIAKSSLIFANYIVPWNFHLRLSEEINKEGLNYSHKEEDLINGSYLSLHYIVNSYHMGKNLYLLKKEVLNSLDLLNSIQSEIAFTVIYGVKFLVDILVGENKISPHFVNNNYLEENFLISKSHISKEYAINIYMIMKAQTLYLHGMYSVAVEILNQIKKSLPILGSINSIAEFNFIESILLTKLIPNSLPHLKSFYLNQVTENQIKMKNWTLNCNENFFHKYLLVEAEIAGLEYKNWKASSLYDLAILEAKKNEFIQNEGIANECASLFYFQRGNQELGQKYLLEAYRCYKEWGAISKCEWILSKYPFIIDDASIHKKQLQH